MLTSPHAGTRHSNRNDLKSLDPQLFQSYLADLLGDYVWNLVARGPGGEAVAADAKQGAGRAVGAKVRADEGPGAALARAWRAAHSADARPWIRDASGGGAVASGESVGGLSKISRGSVDCMHHPQKKNLLACFD